MILGPLLNIYLVIHLFILISLYYLIYSYSQLKLKLNLNYSKNIYSKFKRNKKNFLVN
jgi:hypothetical protein